MCKMMFISVSPSSMRTYKSNNSQNLDSSQEFKKKFKLHVHVELMKTNFCT